MPILLTAVAFAQDSLIGGTQPLELALPLTPSTSCTSCHAGWAEAPHDQLRGSMMAMAMHDPMFQASLTIAEQDIPGIGEFCLRCHTPIGWLAGRCVPGDGSALTGDDYEGIGCDTCHRMTLDPEGPLIGNARYTIHPSTDKRSSRESGYASHGVETDPFTATSELCGVCHEVSNPLFGDFPIERTYSEWAASAYNRAGPDEKQCQGCHLEIVRGYASNSGAPARDVHLHRIVGANTLVPAILAAERPDLGVSAELLATADAAAEHLTKAATVELDTTAPAVAGSDWSFAVTVTNQAGHKLPTGYPEGRRLWLEVVVTDAAGTELLHSGALDPATSALDADDPQLRKYEARLGSGGQYSYHMVEQNEILFDSRIPPKGFRPGTNGTGTEMLPVGRDYPVQPDGSLAHWDTAPYTLALPDTAVTPLTVRATLWHQTTTAEFVAFLRDENVTNELGDEWYRMWEDAGKDAPGAVTDDLATVVVAPAPPPPATTTDDDGGDDDRKGCGCADAGGAGAAAVALGALAALSARRRPREVTSRW